MLGLETTLGHMGGGGMGAWWPLGALLGIGTWALLIAGGVLLARRAGAFGSRRRPEERLAERYAAGELDDDDYDAMLATLSSRRHG